MKYRLVRTGVASCTDGIPSHELTIPSLVHLSLGSLIINKSSFKAIVPLGFLPRVATSHNECCRILSARRGKVPPIVACFNSGVRSPSRRSVLLACIAAVDGDSVVEWSISVLLQFFFTINASNGSGFLVGGAVFSFGSLFFGSLLDTCTGASKWH
jgi:hypothetical protein